MVSGRYGGAKPLEWCPGCSGTDHHGATATRAACKTFRKGRRPHRRPPSMIPMATPAHAAQQRPDSRAFPRSIRRDTVTLGPSLTVAGRRQGMGINLSCDGRVARLDNAGSRAFGLDPSTGRLPRPGYPPRSRTASRKRHPLRWYATKPAFSIRKRNACTCPWTWPLSPPCCDKKWPI